VVLLTGALPAMSRGPKRRRRRRRRSGRRRFDQRRRRQQAELRSGGNGGASDAPYNPFYAPWAAAEERPMWPAGDWTNAANNLTSLASECGKPRCRIRQADADMLIAGVAKEGLWSSTDGGKTWSQLGTGGARTRSPTGPP